MILLGAKSTAFGKLMATGSLAGKDSSSAASKAASAWSNPIGVSVRFLFMNEYRLETTFNAQ